MLWFQTWSCWASWFSRPSTMEAKRSLLFRSAAIVMAARILSRLGEDRGKVSGPDSTINKVLSPRWQDIYSQFSAQTLCIFSHMLAQTFLGSLPQCFCIQIRLFDATRPNFKWIVSADRVELEIFFAGECKTTWNPWVFLKSRLIM